MKRFPLPDLLKGFAILFMVQIHIMELFIDFAGRESLFGKIIMFLGGPFTAILFMIVMGYFIAKNKKSTGQNMMRGIKVFIVGFLLNIALNFHLLLKIKFAGWQLNPLEYIFGVDILYFAGLSIIVLSLLKILKNGQGIIAVLLAVLVLGITSFMNIKLLVAGRNYILPFIGGTYSWAYFPLFPWLAYPLLGFALFHFEEKLMKFVTEQKVTVGIALVLISGAVLYFSKTGFSTTINLPEYYHHTFWFSMWAVGIVILWILLLRFLLHKFPHTELGNFLQWLGKNITLFYVIQWLIIGNIATAIYQTQPIEKYIFWFAGIFSVTVLLTWLIGKTNVKLAR